MKVHARTFPDEYYDGEVLSIEEACINRKIGLEKIKNLFKKIEKPDKNVTVILDNKTKNVLKDPKTILITTLVSIFAAIVIFLTDQFEFESSEKNFIQYRCS